MIWVVATCVLLGISTALLKVSIGTIGALRSFLVTNVFLVSLWGVAVAGTAWRKSFQWSWVAVLSGLLGTLAIVTNFKALQKMPGHVAIVGVSLYPAIAVLVLVCYGERITTNKVCGLVLALAAIVMMSVDGI